VVTFRGQTVKTKTKDGHWMVKLSALKAGGPDVLTVAGKNSTVPREVKMDPRVKESEEDLRRQFELMLKLRDRQDEMNKVISDTAEYGCYLFDNACRPLLKEFMLKIDSDVIGRGMSLTDNAVSNRELVRVDAEIRTHPVEQIGTVLRAYMTAMKPVI